MINFKNIVKVLLMAMFICALSGEVRAQSGKGLIDFNNPNEVAKLKQIADDKVNADTQKSGVRDSTYVAPIKTEPKREATDEEIKEALDKQAQEAAENMASNGEVSASFCSSDFGIFSELVQTGQLIFKRLRDLIYVVAGFGIIAVAVGGFFGNLNWKWLGAIIISLVVIATAGELIVLVTGCDEFGSKLITNTLTKPTRMSSTAYMEQYTVESDDLEKGAISWNDDFAKETRKKENDVYGAKSKLDEEGSGGEGTDGGGYNYKGEDLGENFNPYEMGYKN